MESIEEKELIEQNEKREGKFKSIFSKFSRTSVLTAEQASIMSRFGTRSTSFESVLKNKIRTISDQIQNKVTYSPDEKLLSLYIPKDQSDLYEKIKEYFSELGYNTFYIGKDKVKELGENNYLFISWSDVKKVD